MIDNPAIAAAVLRRCVRLGVQEFCLAAGARNAPLALALTGNSDGFTRLYHFFDERAAGFFALGRSIASRRPVAVVTTSGTAVAELLPAMVEAHYQGVPLVALTADRPPDFRGSGAPQAIEQLGIFACYAPTFDIMTAGEAEGISLTGGPLHINVPLAEPTTDVKVDGGCVRDDLRSVPPTLDKGGLAEVAAFVNQGPLGVAVGSLHPGEAGSVADFLVRLGAPIYPDPASNLQGRPELRELICGGGGRHWPRVVDRVERILRIGGVPVGRWWRNLEGGDHRILNLSPSGYRGVSRRCDSFMVGDFSCLADVTVDSGIGRWPESVVAEPESPARSGWPEFPRSELAMIRAVSQLIQPGEAVFLGNSLPVRDWDLAAEPLQTGVAVFANRGANGIDGAISTALGLGVDYSGIWVVVGDLTALYDLSAPWVIGQLQSGLKIRIVVINNGGGRIFSLLPALSGLSQDQDRVIQNRHQIGFADWASMWGLDYLKIGNAQEFGRDLPLPDRLVVEMVTDDKESSAARRKNGSE